MLPLSSKQGTSKFTAVVEIERAPPNVFPSLNPKTHIPLCRAHAHLHIKMWHAEDAPTPVEEARPNSLLPVTLAPEGVWL